MDYDFDTVDLFDKRWESVPGIEGPVRTGPRGRRFWAFVNEGLLHRFILPEWSATTSTGNNVKNMTIPEPCGTHPTITDKTSNQATLQSVTSQSRTPSETSTAVDRQVSEWQECHKRMDEESYQQQVNKALSNTEPKAATKARVGKIITYLDAINGLRNECSLNRRKNAYGKVRLWILEMHHANVVAEDLEETGVIGQIEDFLQQSDTGLRAGSHEETWLEEELTAIVRKWKRGDLECDPKRGLLLSTKQGPKGQLGRTQYSLDKTWPYYQSALYFGEGNLVNGQTWFSRLELLRDGVHGSAQGGIAGTVDEGAYSIVMSHHEVPEKERYANIDHGEVIEYMGTALKDIVSEVKEETADTNDVIKDNVKSTTACTAAMKMSLRTKRPVRVIRKFKVDKDSSDDSVHGYRYDGLYKVVGETLQCKAKQEWRFKLVRLPGQGPLRKLVTNSARNDDRRRR